MTKCKKFNILPFLLAVIMCFTAFFVSAGANYDNTAEESSEPVKATTKDDVGDNGSDKVNVSLVMKEDGESFTVDSDIVTRDLLYDEATNKQFITVQDRDGNTFYIIIDYDAPVNEDEEQYQTYFLSPVSTDDLAALSEQTEEEPAVCDCADKCTVGSIKTDCPVCVANRNNCIGKEIEPEPEPLPEPVKEKSPFNAGAVLLLLVLLIGGGVFGYLKFIKPKNQTNNGPDPDNFPSNDPDDEDGSDWDDDNDDDYSGYDDSYDDDAEDYGGLDDDDYDDTGGGLDDGEDEM